MRGFHNEKGHGVRTAFERCFIRETNNEEQTIGASLPRFGLIDRRCRLQRELSKFRKDNGGGRRRSNERAENGIELWQAVRVVRSSLGAYGLSRESG